jgi:glutamate/tyrosine decarboxylase-like PLP-dependent enzyme
MMLDPRTREDLWRQVIGAIEDYAREVDSGRVAPELSVEKIRARLSPFDFSAPVPPAQAVDFALQGLRHDQTHTPHARYYGLFNPAPTTMGIAADTLVAAFNPQLAAWSHSPFLVEIEHHLLRAFGARFGYDPEKLDGTFASGGMEANHTAVLTALVQAFPSFAQRGLRALPAQPVLYVSAEGHHSFLKAARLCGLGTDAVREVPITAELAMDAGALSELCAADRRAGLLPFLAVATFGTTNAGALDPIEQVADVAGREGLWLHLDAAWGGAVALVPELRPWMQGSERADSITFDAHKWLSVPMGAGIYLTRHPDILDRTFRTAAAYMPREAAELSVVDPCMHSMQWSRRSIGLKVFLSLAAAGWEGYAAAIRHMIAMGDHLREELSAAGWEVVNRTPLPIACFVDRRHPAGRTGAYVDAIALAVVSSGQAWISTTRLSGPTPVLRACITNFRTGPEEIRQLIATLSRAREQVAASL